MREPGALVGCDKDLANAVQKIPNYFCIFFSF